MIITRTPFRIPLGGGSTDLPAYYRLHGGFIFSVTVNLYMYICLNFTAFDDRIRLKYRESEDEARVSDLRHALARGALVHTAVRKGVEIASVADVPDGTGMGTSGSYLVGLLNALKSAQGENVSRRQLAEEAFTIATRDLKLPDGVQDFYVAAFGNFVVLEIAKNGKVSVMDPKISKETRRAFEKRTLMFYTGVRRSSADLLAEQQAKIRGEDKHAISLKHKTREIGRRVLKAFEAGKLDTFGRLMDEHWKTKKKMSGGMSNPLFDSVYDEAKRAGALGGKVMGAGGGGFFLMYCKDGTQDRVRRVFKKRGMREVQYRVDAAGTQVVFNRNRSTNTI